MLTCWCFLAAAGEFYHDLARVTGASVIVDSSKSPALAALLTQVPGIELHVVHLVRDLRGVVSSGRRTKAYVSATSARRCILHGYWVIFLPRVAAAAGGRIFCGCDMKTSLSPRNLCSRGLPQPRTDPRYIALFWAMDRRGFEANTTRSAIRTNLTGGKFPFVNGNPNLTSS